MVCGEGYARGTAKNEAALIEMVEPVDVEIRAETNTLIHSKRFKDVAEKARNADAEFVYRAI